jgi:hypothetical protein
MTQLIQRFLGESDAILSKKFAPPGRILATNERKEHKEIHCSQKETPINREPAEETESEASFPTG